MTAATHHTIPDDVAVVLRASTVDGSNLTLPAQLERSLYQRTDKILTALGGQWNRKAKAHIFPRPVADVLAEALDTGKVANEKNIRQAFYTPPEIAAQMVHEAHLDLFERPRILEPSCGHGNILAAIHAAKPYPAVIHGFDIDAEALEAAKNRFPHMFFQQRDFLTVPSASFYYDAILMNPPFTKWQYLAHLEHALTFLAEKEGVLVAIMPVSLLGASKKDQAMMDMLNENFAEVATRTLPKGTFKKAGTMVETCMLVVRS